MELHHSATIIIAEVIHLLIYAALLASRTKRERHQTKIADDSLTLSAEHERDKAPCVAGGRTGRIQVNVMRQRVRPTLHSLTLGKDRFAAGAFPNSHNFDTRQVA